MSLSLSIQLNASAIDVMKGFMTRALPNVKSMHRCEAMARGLGFSTYAALRAADAREAAVNGAPFMAYLAAHGFIVSERHLYEAAALVALHDVARRHPNLTVWGIGIGEYRREDGGHCESRASYEQRLRQERQALTADSSSRSFLLSLALVQRLPSIATIRPGAGSYKLKHIAENYACSYPGGDVLGPRYVPNGLLIAAASHAGFKFKEYRSEGSGLPEINVSFNMPKRAIEDLDCEIRPDGATAQSRARRAEMMRQHGPLLRYLSYIRSQDDVSR